MNTTFKRPTFGDMGLSREEKLEARARRNCGRVEAHRAAPPLAKGVIESATSAAQPIPKENAIQSDAYERAAKGLGYCMRCARQVVPHTGALDFCHRDMGKGQGIKTDSREGWPGCRECHEEVGRVLVREVRRAVEILLAVMTRAAIREAGTWPKRLGEWV